MKTLFAHDLRHRIERRPVQLGRLPAAGMDQLSDHARERAAGGDLVVARPQEVVILVLAEVPKLADVPRPARAPLQLPDPPEHRPVRANSTRIRPFPLALNRGRSSPRDSHPLTATFILA